MSDECNVSHIQEENLLVSKYIPALIVHLCVCVCITNLPNICLLAVWNDLE